MSYEEESKVQKRMWGGQMRGVIGLPDCLAIEPRPCAVRRPLPEPAFPAQIGAFRWYSDLCPGSAYNRRPCRVPPIEPSGPSLRGLEACRIEPRARQP